MDLADGNGGLIHIPPLETKIVRGDFNYFRRAAKQIGGLVVKVAPGGPNGKVDHDYAPANVSSDVHKVKIYNHREIPLRLATGVDRQHVDIPRQRLEEDPSQPGKQIKVPGEVTCVARVSLIKQMGGISVVILDKEKQAATPAAAALTRKAKAEAEAEAKKKESTPTRKPDTPVLKIESDADTPKTSEPPADSLESLRENLGLPHTSEEFVERARQITWHDLRGMCRQLGFSRPQSSRHAIQLIGTRLYPDFTSGGEKPDEEKSDEAKDEKESKSSKKAKSSKK